MIRKVARVILPAGSRRRIAAGKFKAVVLEKSLGNSYKYKIWIKRTEPQTLSPLVRNQRTRFSIVVPAFNTREKYIKQLVESVATQTYQNWQLIIGDGSSDKAAAKKIQKYCNCDERITYEKLEENLGISGNTNQALELASGDYIVFLDHDDILPRWSLNELAVAIARRPEADIIYSDEDRLSEDGKIRMTPFFKPDWSPDFFLSANYVTHLFTIRRTMLEKLGGLRSKYDGSQDYDLMLRAIEQSPIIIHVPKILYHMRMAKGSTARAITEKDYVHTTGQRAIRDFLKRNKIEAEVLSIPDRPTNHRIKYKIKDNPKASIIIPFKDKPRLLKNCLEPLIAKTRYTNYELILISNNSQEDATRHYLASLKDKRIRKFEYNQPFNYSKINNFGRSKAKGDVLVFLNNDTEITDADWLEELVSVAARPEIGAAGALLHYPDGTIQHAGVVLGMTGLAGHIFRGLHLGTLTPFWLPDWPRNYLAVTGACLAVETKKFDQIGGFNEDFVVAGSDVVLCLDLHEKGYRNLYWPFAKLIHHESRSVGSYKNAPISDYRLSRRHYRKYLKHGDHYFNYNLSLKSEVPELKKYHEG